jgi:hypothetical protein
MTHRCPPDCPHCEGLAEDRKAARDEPLSEWEEGRLDDWAESEMERTWP